MDRARYISRIFLNSQLPSDSYLSDLPAIQYLSHHHELVLPSNVTIFVGENGTGKSTLLEAIAIAYGFNAEGGSINFNFSTNDTHSNLWKNITLEKRGFPKDGFFLRAESLYNVATNIDEMDEQTALSPLIIESYGGVSLHNQSHGESFLNIVQNRFFGNGLYILDEPEAALSPMRLLTLISEIHRLVGDNSQFIIATHSPMLLAFPGASVLEFSTDGIREIPYRKSEHFLVTRSFLENPEKLLSHILNLNSNA